jgi:DNA mismatch repair protein MutL
VPAAGLSGNHLPGDDTLPGSLAGKAGIRVIGQVLGTYILAETADGLLLVDQHAAHERVVYEKLKRRAGAFRPPSQQLLVPETLELGSREAVLLNGMLEQLLELGFEVDPFGETTFLIKAHPAIIEGEGASRLLMDMVESVLDTGADPAGSGETTAWMDRLLTLTACHAAIRAGQRLDSREMDALIRDLDDCQNPDHCPHGRPTRILWSRTQMEKLFKRLV